MRYQQVENYRWLSKKALQAYENGLQKVHNVGFSFNELDLIIHGMDRVGYHAPNASARMYLYSMVTEYVAKYEECKRFEVQQDSLFRKLSELDEEASLALVYAMEDFMSGEPRNFGRLSYADRVVEEDSKS